MARRTLLLDLDGTLWDSRPWYAEILARLSGDSATELEDTLASGVNIRRLASERGVTSHRFDREAGRSAVSLRLYDGVLQTLDDLSNLATSIGVVTNLPGRLVETVLQETGIASHLGSDRNATRRSAGQAAATWHSSGATGDGAGSRRAYLDGGRRSRRRRGGQGGRRAFRLGVLRI